MSQVLIEDPKTICVISYFLGFGTRVRGKLTLTEEKLIFEPKELVTLRKGVDKRVEIPVRNIERVSLGRAQSFSSFLLQGFDVGKAAKLGFTVDYVEGGERKSLTFYPLTTRIRDWAELLESFILERKWGELSSKLPKELQSFVELLQEGGKEKVRSFAISSSVVPLPEGWRIEGGTSDDKYTYLVFRKFSSAINVCWARDPKGSKFRRLDRDIRDYIMKGTLEGSKLYKWIKHIPIKDHRGQLVYCTFKKEGKRFIEYYAWWRCSESGRLFSVKVNVPEDRRKDIEDCATIINSLVCHGGEFEGRLNLEGLWLDEKLKITGISFKSDGKFASIKFSKDKLGDGVVQWYHLSLLKAKKVSDLRSWCAYHWENSVLASTKYTGEKIRGYDDEEGSMCGHEAIIRSSVAVKKKRLVPQSRPFWIIYWICDSDERAYAVYLNMLPPEEIEGLVKCHAQAP